MFGGFVVFAVGLSVLVGLFLPSTYLRGLVLGATLVAAPGAIWVFAMQQTGTAPVMMGEIAEQWTAQDLRRLTRRGWRLVNHLALRVDDIDHVLIGPGGAFAIETKWSASFWESDLGRDREQRAVDQARGNARSLRLWSAFRSRRISAAPVVVLWGRGLKSWPEEMQIRHVDDVVVIAGPALPRWLDGLGDDVLTDATVAEAWTALDAHAARRDPVDSEAHPIPTSFAEWAGLSAVGVGAAMLAVIVASGLVDLLHSGWIVLALGLVFAGAGVAIGRRTSSRIITWATHGWAGGMLLPAVAVAVLAVTSLF